MQGEKQLIKLMVKAKKIVITINSDPMDKAVNYRLNDLRIVWTVKFSTYKLN